MIKLQILIRKKKTKLDKKRKNMEIIFFYQFLSGKLKLNIRWTFQKRPFRLKTSFFYTNKPKD